MSFQDYLKNMENKDRIFKVKDSFPVWINTGEVKKSNYYYGSTQIILPVFEKYMTMPDDEIHIKHGTCYIIKGDDPRSTLLAVSLIEPKSPFEKEYRSQYIMDQLPDEKYIEEIK